MEAANWGAHPDFCGAKSCGEDIYDIGYVVLPSDFVLPDGYPAPIVTQDEWDEAVHGGAAVTLVGYGEADNDDPTLPESGIGFKRMVDVKIERLSHLGLEFYAGGHGKDTCLGDSGGPAFATLDDGTTRLAGILSRGSQPCGDGGFYGAPYAGLCWLRDETGVDLVPTDCGDCDCLDTKPPESCACRASEPTHGPLGSLTVVFALGLWRRGRRQASSSR